MLASYGPNRRNRPDHVHRLYRIFFAAFVLAVQVHSGAAPVAESVSPRLSISIVQFEVSTALCIDSIAFEDAVEEIVSDIAEERHGLIVFPEYTSALLGFAYTYGHLLDVNDTVQTALEKIAGTYGPGYDQLGTLFRQSAASAEDYVDEIWGSLARTYKTYIIGGTLFAFNPDTGELRNRAIVYDPHGVRTYEQDKVYLTPFEISLLGMSAGRLEETGMINIEGVNVALTICRDTFFDAWDLYHAEADVWLDLKANGIAYDDEQARLFRRALPERIAQSGVPVGGTVCLTGSVFEFLWEGVSSFVESDKLGGYTTIATSESANRYDVIEIEIF